MIGLMDHVNLRSIRISVLTALIASPNDHKMDFQRLNRGAAL